MSQIELGDKVKDIVTGVVGIAIGKSSWITGCDQYCVQQGKVSAEGKVSDGLWFDENRLSVVKRGACKIESDNDPKPKTGGPRHGY